MMKIPSAFITFSVCGLILVFSQHGRSELGHNSTNIATSQSTQLKSAKDGPNIEADSVSQVLSPEQKLIDRLIMHLYGVPTLSRDKFYMHAHNSEKQKSLPDLPLDKTDVLTEVEKLEVPVIVENSPVPCRLLNQSHVRSSGDAIRGEKCPIARGLLDQVASPSDDLVIPIYYSGDSLFSAGYYYIPRNTAVLIVKVLDLNIPGVQLPIHKTVISAEELIRNLNQPTTEAFGFLTIASIQKIFLDSLKVSPTIDINSLQYLPIKFFPVVTSQIQFPLLLSNNLLPSTTLDAIMVLGSAGILGIIPYVVDPQSPPNSIDILQANTGSWRRAASQYSFQNPFGVRSLSGRSNLISGPNRPLVRSNQFVDINPPWRGLDGSAVSSADLQNWWRLSADGLDQDGVPKFRIIGGRAATYSGVPINNRGRRMRIVV